LNEIRTPASSSVRAGSGFARTRRADAGWLRENLLEVIEMLREDGEPSLEATFVGF
jgi:hypothetical protein